MPVTAMSVYKNLPRTNCKDCNFPTCMAFAMQVAAKQKALTDCPHLSTEAKSEFSEASAPPMRLVRIGPEGEKGFEIGQETVMFRHEERFQKPPGIAVRIPASLSADDAAARLEQINGAVFMRVGDELGVRLAAVEVEGLSAEDAAARVGALSEKSRVPFVIMGKDPVVLSAAVKAVAGKKPLIYKAEGSNAQALVALAAETKCPLAVGAETLDGLVELTKAAKEKGAEDLILAFDGRKTAESIRQITLARRAALRKNFRALGYPSMVDACCDDPMKETVLASTFAAKYAGIILIDGVDGSELLPILTTVQNIYTDPQVPNTVEAKLYAIGDPDENSPVLFTTNFSLTYFSVEGEVERSKIPAWISVIDTEGLGVLNAYAGDKISAESVVKTLRDQKVAEKVKHRKVIIPGRLPSFRPEIEDSSEWKEVLIGPETAAAIPAFLKEHFS